MAMMLAPYTSALKMPRCRLSLPLVKSDTVMGTIGNTQGVIRAAGPKVNASSAKPHRPPALLTGFSGVIAGAAGAAATASGLCAAPGAAVVGLAGPVTASCLAESEGAG